MSFGGDLAEVGRAEKTEGTKVMDMKAIKEKLIANGFNEADVDEMIDNTIHVEIVGEKSENR